MATITEDYVSLETAKLLNDKGFGQPTIGTYNIESKNPILIERPIRAIHCEAIISAPTLQMAMKWLREVHKIYIDITIRIILGQWAGHNISIYKIDTNNGLLDKVISRIGLKDNTSYEKACEAAIKYCLENLI